MAEINGIADDFEVVEAGADGLNEAETYDGDDQNEPQDWEDIISLINATFRKEKISTNEKIEEVAKTLKEKYSQALKHSRAYPKPFLHHLLDERKTARRCPQGVLEAILSYNPASIQLPTDGSDGDTHPLTMAIQDSALRKKGWPETMIQSLETFFGKTAAKPILRNKSREGEKCVQTAFDTFSDSDPLSLSLLRKLVGWSTEDMLNPTNPKGLIPLQRAVMYEQGFMDSEQQPKLVRELLEKCGSCLYINVPADVKFKSVYFDGTLQSPYTLYQWHKHTKTNFRQPPPPPAHNSNDVRCGRSNISSGNTVDEKPSGKPTLFTAPPRRPTMDLNAPQSPRASSRSRDGKQEELLENRASQRGPQQKYERGEQRADNEKPTVKPRGAQSWDAKSGTAEFEQKKQKADQASREVCQELELRCLRATIETPTTADGRELVNDCTMYAEESYAVKFLDVPPGTYLQLDFSEHPKGEKIRESVVKDFFTRREVNQTLRYLSIPQAEVELDPDPHSGCIAEYPDNRMFFFDWLHTKKGVDKILKVIVDDTAKPHRNKAIEEAIGGKGSIKHAFDIEFLQWRKVDLCPETIARAAPNVRELHLEWSGSNAALLGWSDPEGLPKLEFLKQIHLSYNIDVEGERRINQYIAKFELRLGKCRKNQQEEAQKPQPVPKQQTEKELKAARKALNGRYPNIVVFKHPQRPRDNGNGTQAAGQKESSDDPSHEWLKYMDNFVQYVPALDGIRNRRPEIGDLVSRNVKVALIDDGVDIFTEKGLTKEWERARIMDGESFDLADGRQFASQYYSYGGHGTLMAKLILAVCPRADIVPYRVLVRPDEKTGRPSPDPESAAKAIKEAIKEDVDIISMSWTITGNAKGQDEAEGSRFYELENAFWSMPLRRIPLLFCSAADDNVRNSEGMKEYPYSCKGTPGQIFRIGAAKSTGETWTQISTNPDGINYYFPGVKVPDLEERFKYQLKKIDYDPITRSGSSIATAFAAGLAALILHLTKLAIYVNDEKHTEQIYESDLKNLMTFYGMDIAFKRITSKNLTNQQFGYPAQRFEKSALDMERLSKSRRLEFPGSIRPIADLVRNIIGWKDSRRSIDS